MTPLVRLVAVALLGLPLLSAPAPAQAAARTAPTAGQSTYTALEPVRLLDTVTARRPVPSGGSVDVVLGSRVPATARSVVLNVTGLGAAAPTEVEAVGAGTPPTGNAQLPVSPGAVAAEIVVVPVGQGGRVTLHNTGSAVYLLADLTGYYAEAEGAGYVAAAAPRRLLDTRSAGGPLGAGAVRTLQVTGAQVPAGATAAVLNVTALGATKQTDVRVYPTRAGAPPVVSLTNPALDRPTNAVAIATLSSDGRVSLRNAAGSVHLVVDLQGWYVPGDGAVFHPVPVSRALTTTLAGGQAQDLVVAGKGAVPAQASAVALTVRVARTSVSSDVRVWPAGTAAPDASNLYAVRGGPAVANGVVAKVGRSGAVSLRTTGGSADLRVDVAGWWGPRGRGWDVSWPQCTTEGPTTATTPTGGAFAVVGLNRRVPFTDNECFAAEWAWASSLPGEPAVYVNVNAPGSASPQWAAAGPRPCSGASDDRGCAFDYGYALAGYVVARLPATPSGGTPFVWFDVENGPVWQGGYGSAFLVNREVLNGAAQGLRDAGVTRYGIYTDGEPYAADDPTPANDWVQIMGRWSLPALPLWQFTSTTTHSRTTCARTGLLPGGPVHLVQLRPEQSGEAFDVDDAC